MTKPGSCVAAGTFPSRELADTATGHRPGAYGFFQPIPREQESNGDTNGASPWW
jgi:hypothetical protein